MRNTGIEFKQLLRKFKFKFQKNYLLLEALKESTDIQVQGKVVQSWVVRLYKKLQRKLYSSHGEDDCI